MKNINEEIRVAISDSKRDLLHRVWYKDRTPGIVKWDLCDRVSDILVRPVNRFYNSACMDINAHIETQMRRS